MTTPNLNALFLALTPGARLVVVTGPARYEFATVDEMTVDRFATSFDVTFDDGRKDSVLSLRGTARTYVDAWDEEAAEITHGAGIGYYLVQAAA